MWAIPYAQQQRSRSFTMQTYPVIWQQIDMLGVVSHINSRTVWKSFSKAASVLCVVYMMVLLLETNAYLQCSGPEFTSHIQNKKVFCLSALLMNFLTLQLAPLILFLPAYVLYCLWIEKPKSDKIEWTVCRSQRQPGLSIKYRRKWGFSSKYNNYYRI